MILAFPGNPTAPVSVRHIVPVIVTEGAASRTEYLNVAAADRSDARFVALQEAVLLFPGSTVRGSDENVIRIGD